MLTFTHFDLHSHPLFYESNPIWDWRLEVKLTSSSLHSLKHHGFSIQSNASLPWTFPSAHSIASRSSLQITVELILPVQLSTKSKRELAMDICPLTPHCESKLTTKDYSINPSTATSILALEMKSLVDKYPADICTCA